MQFATPSNRRARHSFCIVHSALCFFSLVAFAASAEIPATLEKDTAYVVDGETGAGPAAIYVENASLSLVNGAKLDFTSTKCATDKQGGGTNFFLHVAGGSTVTNYPSIGTRSGARLVVEDGSQIHYRASNTPLSSTGNRDIVLAFTNSLFNAAGNVNINIRGDNTLLALCSSRIVGSFTLQTYGHGNRIVFSGNSTATMAIALFNGTNNWVVVEDGARAIGGNGFKLQNYSSGTNGFHVGRGAFLWGGASQGPTVRNGHIIVEEGGEYAMYNGDGNGFQGIDCEWIVNNGTISCSNNMLRIGQKESTYRGLRLVLNGDRASVFSKNTQVGHASNPTGLTIVYRPGPEGFGGTAPLRSTGSGGIYGCVIDIDLRAPLRRTAPNAILQVPIMKTSGTLTCSAATLEILNSHLVSNPAGAEIVKDGNTLYCQIKNKATTMLMVR